jgi:hypothetical protein
MLRLLVDRDGVHVEGDGRAGESVGAPVTTVERRGSATCVALLTAEACEQLARVLLLRAGRLR